MKERMRTILLIIIIQNLYVCSIFLFIFAFCLFFVVVVCFSTTIGDTWLIHNSLILVYLSYQLLRETEDNLSQEGISEMCLYTTNTTHTWLLNWLVLIYFITCLAHASSSSSERRKAMQWSTFLSIVHMTTSNYTWLLITCLLLLLCQLKIMEWFYGARSITVPKSQPHTWLPTWLILV